jgi:hypothetical protein
MSETHPETITRPGLGPGHVDASYTRDDVWREQLAAVTAERDKAYRERAHLVAYLAACYPSVLAIDIDPDAPGWAVIFVETPTGQMSWHVSGDDLDLFLSVEHADSDEPQVPKWDGHTTEEKYRRLAELTASAAREALAARAGLDGGQ